MFRLEVLLFQQADSFPDGFLITSYRLIPYGRVASASGCTGTPVDGYRIRPVYGLPDMYRVGGVQPDFLHNRQHAVYPAVFVELFAYIAENQTSFIRAYVKYDLAYTLAETLKIGDLFRIITAYSQQVTENGVAFHSARFVFYNFL